MDHIRKHFVLHATTIEEAIVLLNSDTEDGLSFENAQERLQRFGRNAIAEAKSLSLLQILFNQLRSPIVFLLLLKIYSNEFITKQRQVHHHHMEN